MFYAVLLSSLCVITLPIRAQDRWSEPGQDPRDPNLRAKAELANPQPPLAPVPEDYSPDVAKRPALRNALAQKRLWTGMYSVFTLESFLPGETIPTGAKDKLRSRWEAVVAPQYQPLRSEDLEWRAADEYPTAPEQRSLGARWTTTIGTIMVGGSTAYDGITACLQLSGEDRVSFRFLQRDKEGSGAATRFEDVNPQDIVDKPHLLGILTTCFRFPFESTDDFMVISGPSGIYEGVRIFSGSIRWSRRLVADNPDIVRLGHGNASFNEARLGITDSDPQYLCVGVTIPQDEP